MLGTLYVETADLQSAADPSEGCGLYGEAVALFERMSTAGALAPDRQELFSRAKSRWPACRGRS
jgi:hypothetical protein